MTHASKKFVLMKTEAFSWNIGKFFQSRSWYQRTLFSEYTYTWLYTNVWQPWLFLYQSTR